MDADTIGNDDTFNTAYFSIFCVYTFTYVDTQKATLEAKN